MSAAATAAPAVQEARPQSMQALLPDARRSLGAGPDDGGSPRIQALQVSAVLRGTHALHCHTCWATLQGQHSGT